MPEDEEGKLKSVRNFFARIGRGVIWTGETTRKMPSRVTKATERKPPSKEEETSLSRRLQELKQLEMEEPEEEERAWEEGEEVELLGEREELERPISDRFADIFSGIFGRPASRLSNFFSGLDEDLSRANMRTSAERYLTFLLGAGLIVGILAFFFVGFLFELPVFGIIAAVGGFILVIFVGRFQPKSRISSRASEVNQEIPYALRHMATQLSSGIGLSETMTSVSRANYGALSEEFRRALQEMRTGESMQNALTTLVERVDSDPLKRAVRQIQRTLRTGGNLSRTLGILADESAFDLRMKLRDYTQSLNMMTMVYMFSSAIIPSLLIVVMVVMQFMGGGLIPPEMMSILFLLVIPFLLFYFVMLFKRMEPEV